MERVRHKPNASPVPELRSGGGDDLEVDVTDTIPTPAPQPQEFTAPAPKGTARQALEKLGRRVSKPSPESTGATVDVAAGQPMHKVRASRGRGAVYAAIDLGSSSAKLLVERVSGSGRVQVLLDKKLGVTLGKGVQNGQPIPADNQQRALEGLKEFVLDAQRLGVLPGEIPLITTAVVRNSSNGAAFMDAVRGLGLVRATTLSGDEEAQNGYLGALLMLHGRAGRYATLDLGGGSFQLAAGTEDALEAAASTQVGSNVILDTVMAPLCGADGVLDGAHFVVVDQWLQHNAPMPLEVEQLRGRTLVAIGGVSRFLRAHFGSDHIRTEDVDALRRAAAALPEQQRVALVRQNKDAAQQLALGIDTDAGALDYGRKLPAAASLLLHILRALELEEVHVSQTDARHLLIQRRIDHKSRG